MNVDLLREVVSRRRPDLLPYVARIGAGPLTNEQWNELRAVVGYELVETGFAADSEPNERGLELERLIDELAPWHHNRPDPA